MLALVSLGTCVQTCRGDDSGQQAFVSTGNLVSWKPASESRAVADFIRVTATGWKIQSDAARDKLTCAGFAVGVQHESSVALAKVRVTVRDAHMLTVVSLDAGIHTCRETLAEFSEQQHLSTCGRPFLPGKYKIYME